MLRLLIKLAAALTITAAVTSPAGTAERVHRTHSGSIGSLGGSEA